MIKFIVITEDNLTEVDQVKNKAALLWKNELTLKKSNQYILRISEEIESQFRDYIKYSTSEIGIARQSMAYLPERKSMPSESLAFASKVLVSGGKLFKRVHGIKSSLDNETKNIELVVPYDNCKITGVELIGGSLGDSVNLKVLDTPTGRLSTIPNYMLNQFGFNVYISKGYHKETSAYDADLIKDMKLLVEYKTAETKDVYVNFILHEVK